MMLRPGTRARDAGFCNEPSIDTLISEVRANPVFRVLFRNRRCLYAPPDRTVPFDNMKPDCLTKFDKGNLKQLAVSVMQASFVILYTVH